MASQSVGFSALLSRVRNLFSGQSLLTEPDDRRRQARSVFIRHLDAGSCNDCELEITALSNPVYDFERFGLHIVASPRHADVLLVSGPFTRSMETAALVAFRAMPEPRRVVTVGDGFRPDGIFSGSYAVLPLPQEMVPYWVVHILGDPPPPQHILDVLLTLDTK
jgi:Ni,Fe-hydrogenase III small subunit